MFLPKFDMNLFIHKLHDIGRKASARVFCYDFYIYSIKLFSHT